MSNGNRLSIVELPGTGKQGEIPLFAFAAGTDDQHGRAGRPTLELIPALVSGRRDQQRAVSRQTTIPLKRKASTNRVDKSTEALDIRRASDEDLGMEKELIKALAISLPLLLAAAFTVALIIGLPGRFSAWRHRRQFRRERASYARWLDEQLLPLRAAQRRASIGSTKDEQLIEQIDELRKWTDRQIQLSWKQLGS